MFFLLNGFIPKGLNQVFFTEISAALGESRWDDNRILDNNCIYMTKDIGFSLIHYFPLRGGVI